MSRVRMSRVFVLTMHIDYEGETVLGVYSTQTAAFSAIKQRMPGALLAWEELHQHAGKMCLASVDSPFAWGDCLKLHEVDVDALPDDFL